MHFPKFTKCVFMLQPDDHRCYHVMSKPVMDSLLSHFVPSSTKVNLCWSEHTGMAGLINCVVRYCTKTLSQPHTQGFLVLSYLLYIEGGQVKRHMRWHS